MRRRRFAAATIAAGAWTGGFLVAPGTRAADPLSSATGGAVLPEYFGMHVHRLVNDVGNRSPTRWPQDAIGSLRLWDSTTRWADIAPRPGRWDFTRLDAHVALAEASGVPVLYTLGSTPRWASARPAEPGPYGPGCAAEPLALADWQDYVHRVATRYRGRIAAYEVWNEPYFADLAADRGQPSFFSGSVAQMMEMTRIARSAIKAADPVATLATPGFVNGAHRLDLFLASGGADLVDVVAYHFYASDAAQFTSQIAEVRAVMARRHVSHLPLWNTECGVEGEPLQEAADPAAHATTSDREAASRLSQFLILGAASRLERFYYHAWDNDRTGMVDRVGTPNLRAPAWHQTRRWLEGSRLAAPIPVGPRAFRVDAEQAGERHLIAWSDRDEAIDLRLPAGTRIVAAEHLFGDAVEPPVSASVASRRFVLTPAPVRLRLTRPAAT